MQATRSQLESGTARLDELSRLSKQTAMARQQTERAWAEAIEDAQAKAAAAAVAPAEKNANRAAAVMGATTTAAATEADGTPGVNPRETKAGTIQENESAVVVAAAASQDRVDHEELVPALSDSKRPAMDYAESAKNFKRQRTSSVEEYADASDTAITNSNADNALQETLNPAAPSSLAPAPPPPPQPLHPVFAKREQATKEVRLSTAATVLDMAREAGTLAEKIAACEGKLATAAVSMGNRGGDGEEGFDHEGTEPSVSDHMAASEELEVLMESKAKASQKLTGTSIESAVAAMEVIC